MLNRSALCLFLLLSSSYLRAQTYNFDYTSPTTVSPPSPNVASLMKFVDVPVSYYTGQPQISFPLHTLQSSFAAVNIGLNYNASGYKVEEEATWVGLGWSLSAGGIITRSVMAQRDEFTPGYRQDASQLHLPLYTDANAGDWINTLSYIEQFNLINNKRDLAPDVYYINFNGYSAKLYFDQNGNPFISPYKAWRVQGNEQAGFVITVEDGTRYEFNTVENTLVDESGGNNLNTYNSSWFLTKIKAPNLADSIVFSYQPVHLVEDSKNPTETWQDLYPGTTQLPCVPTNIVPAFQKVTSTSTKTSNSYILSSITSRDEKILFLVKNDRQDADDGMVQRLSEIKIFDQAHNTLIKHFKFDHLYGGNTASASTLDKRLMLADYKQVSATGTDSLTYTFNYLNPALIPSKNSKAQDHWGYYNGVNNSTLVPVYNDNNGIPVFTTGADREPRATLASTGILNQINYPTGGTVKFTYETNDYSYLHGQYIDSQHQLDSVQTQITATASTNSLSTSSGTVVKTFTVPYSSSPPVVSYYIHGKITGDPLAQVSISENGTSIWVAGNDTQNKWVVIPTTASPNLIAGHTYTIIAERDQSSETAMIQVTYFQKQVVPLISHSKLTGGIRIKTIAESGNPDSTKNMIRLFKYTSSDSTISSGNISNLPIYMDFVQIPVLCSSGNQDHSFIGGYTATYQRHSSCLNALGSTQGGVVGYSKVTVLYGQNGENGKEEFYYTTKPYDQGGNGYPYIPPTSYDDLRGLLTRHITYNGSGVALKKTTSTYNLNDTVGSPNFAWVYGAKLGGPSSEDFWINSNVGWPDRTGIATPCKAGMYKLLQLWPTLASTTDSLYSAFNNLYTTTTSKFTYDNSSLLLTKDVHYKSNGDSVITLYTYPQNYTGQAVYDLMQNQHIINKPIQKTILTNNSQSYLELRNYSIFGANLPEIQSVGIQNGNKPIETRYNFYNYDIVGNVLEEGKNGEAHIAYQWGYNYQYPAAQATNTKVNDIFYDSFEEGNGNSTLNDSKTGHYSHTGTYSKSLSGLDNGGYILTYWKKSGSNWQLQTLPVTVSGNTYQITLSSGQIDDIRFYPSTAQMTTYTYDPLVGVTSSTDAKGLVSYYEYDSFQRLLNVKDQDGNILKSYDYHYRPQ